MALKSTIFKAVLQISDLDRPHFGEYTLTLAQHPSETLERLMVRLLAYALYASEDLRFGKGLSAEDEPALSQVDTSGVMRYWIDVGLPDENRLKKASSRAERVVLIAYGGRSVDVWWKQQADALRRYKNLDIFQMTDEDSRKLTCLANRNMKLTWTIQESSIYIENAQINLINLQSANR